MAKQVTSQKDITFVWNEIDPTNGFCRNVDDTLTLENEMLNSEKPSQSVMLLFIPFWQ